MTNTHKAPHKLLRLLFTITLIPIFLSGCVKSIENSTLYSENREQDRSNHSSIEDSRDALADGIGQDTYDDLVDKLGQQTLDLLVYDSGESNMVSLINAVITCGGTADKLVDLIAETVASPTKISAETVLALMNETDNHLRTEPVLPHGNDTIAKVANMICKVVEMDNLVYLVNNITDWSAGGSPPETEAIERLTVVLALINENADTMPTVINEIADTANGRTKLVRLVDEVEDLRNLTTIMNEVDVLQNILTIIDLVDITAPTPNGVDALVTTMNLVDKPEDMAYLVNELATASSNVDNDGWANNNWGTTGPQKWNVAGATATTNAALNDNQVATIEIAANIVTTGNISFDLTTSTESGADYLKFYIDDVLQGLWSGTTSTSVAFSVSTTGAKRFRWEYSKNGDTTNGSDTVSVSNVALPGNAGTSRTASEKVAIMLNQLNISAQSTVAEIMNDVNTDLYPVTGLDNLISIVNEVEYPLNFSDEPRLVTVVNGITAVTTMTALLRDLNGQGLSSIIEIMDHAPDVAQVSDLVNEMNDGGLGSKMTGILNGLDMVGSLNIAKLVDGVNNADLVTLIDQATVVSHMSTIFNELYLHGSPGHVTVSTSCGYSGGTKMTEVISQTALGTNSLGISSHLVRLINDIANSGGGPAAVGQIVGGLDPLASNSPGVDRMIALLDERSQQNAPLYVDPLSTSTTDEFGRIITLVNEMGGDGPANMARLINEISCNDIGNTSNCRVYNMADLVRDTTRIVYVSRLISEMTNVDLVIDLLNDAATDFTKVQTLLNATGDDAYLGGIPPANTYSNHYEWPATDEDYLGRLIVTINNVAGAQGISNIISLINGVTYVDGSTDNFSILVDLIKDTHRVVYMTRLISDATDLSLVVDLINEINPADAAEIARLQDLMNEFGDNSYGVGNGIGTDPAPAYTDAMSTATNDELGRLITFINDLNVQVQATGSSQAQAITNAVSMIMDSYDLNYIMDFLRGVNRLRYITHLVAQIDNIGLMMTIINGEAGDGSDGAELPKLLTVINNYGGSTRLGANQTGKAVGEMTLFADVIDTLGSGRPISDQARITLLVNDVIYCGIIPSEDLNISGAGSPSDFFGCDSDVDYDYDSNKGSVVYDQRHRLSNLMLGLDDANAMAIIVGDVTDTNKTIRMVNGVRRINAVIQMVRWMPGEVARDLMNYTDLDVVYSSLVYMANNLSPDEDEAAQAFASMIHYGTGISHTTNRNDAGNCHYYAGIGPKRLAELMNIEPGAYLEGIIQMFGWRSSIPAMGCAFGTPNVGGATQNVNGSLGTGTFADVEYVYTNSNQTGPILYTYDVPANSNWCRSTGSGTSSIGYMPEESGALGYFEHSDTIVWSGFSALGLSVPPGLGGIWEVLKGQGAIGWLLQNGGSMGLPPVDQAQYGAPVCSSGGHGNEWDCIKTGKDVSPNISDRRWGNFCTIPGYTTPGPCESNGGRWMPDKNWAACFVDPSSDSAVDN